MKSYTTKIHTLKSIQFQSGKHYLIALFSILMIVLLSGSLQAQEYLRVYTSQPSRMTSDETGGTLVTEDFSSFNSLPNFNWAPMPNGYVSPVGTYYQTGGKSYVKNDDQYGAGTGKYMAIQVGGKVDLVFNNPVRYFGFAWPAGDGKNTITIYRKGQVIGTFTTSDVIKMLPNDKHNSITAINGSKYVTSKYYGKPGTGQDSGEPFAYLHFVASAGLAFDKVEFTMGAGGEFENDNHSVLTTGTPELQGDWVQLISIKTPTALDDSATGTPGNAVTVDVLSNDVKGDGKILASTVQISGTSTAGASLHVAGEGVWSVDTKKGDITFTPDASLVGSPAPIEYFVRDDNGFASNLATVKVTYPVGPRAVDDQAMTEMNHPIAIPVLDNDTAGSTALVPSTLELVPGTKPNPAQVGTFTVDNSNGRLIFTPVTGFTGTATIQYRIYDQNNLSSTATVTVNVVTGTTNYYPASGFGTLAFEDLWPFKGDYDFNDMVIDYQFVVTTNTSNYVENVKGTFILKAFGASYQNGFGFQLSSAINPNDLTVTGSQLKENIITLNSNGTEAGQTIPTIIVLDNAYKLMPPQGGIGVNTTPGEPYITPDTIHINIDFKPNTYTYNDLDIADFNPFIFVNQDRTVEVHLPGYPPTALANMSLFGTGDDNSNPAAGRYYETKNNLPWAINLYDSFDYPVEKVAIVNAYLKFAAWATSGGSEYQDWYKDLSGYRNSSNIYVIPKP